MNYIHRNIRNRAIPSSSASDFIAATSCHKYALDICHADSLKWRLPNISENAEFIVENNVLVGMNGKRISCYDDYLKHDYIIPEDVIAIKGKDFVPFAMNKFQITTNVKKIDWKAFGKCACIKKFVVIDAETKKVVFRKRFEINQGSCQNPNITLLPEFREFVKGYPKNLKK